MNRSEGKDADFTPFLYTLAVGGERWDRGVGQCFSVSHERSETFLWCGALLQLVCIPQKIYHVLMGSGFHDISMTFAG